MSRHAESKAEERREDKKEEEKRKREHKRAAGGGIAAEVGQMKDRGAHMVTLPAEKENKAGRARGGRMRPERRRGGKVEGKKPEHRLDRRARGGGMHSPMSGASVTEPAYARSDAPASKPESTGRERD